MSIFISFLQEKIRCLSFKLTEIEREEEIFVQKTLGKIVFKSLNRFTSRNGYSSYSLNVHPRISKRILGLTSNYVWKPSRKVAKCPLNQHYKIVNMVELKKIVDATCLYKKIGQNILGKDYYAIVKCSEKYPFYWAYNPKDFVLHIYFTFGCFYLNGFEMMRAVDFRKGRRKSPLEYQNQLVEVDIKPQIKNTVLAFF